MQILIIGYGYVGKHLAELALIAGHNVHATTRNPKTFQTLTQSDPNISPLMFGEPLPEGITHILVTAPPEDGKDSFYHTYADQLPHSLLWLGYCSTTGVYAEKNGDWVDEDSPLGATGARAQARIQVEQAYQSLNVPLCLLRLSGIYGDDKNTLLRVKDGAQGLPENTGPINRIHVNDIARLTLGAMLQRLTGTYNISDDQPASTRDCVLQACAHLGIEPSTLPKVEGMKQGFGGEGFRKVRNDKIKGALQLSLQHPSFQAYLNSLR